MADPFLYICGRTPLLVSLPHDSTYIPPAMIPRMTKSALTTPDTDWHVARLYDFAASMGASVLTATHSRYVVDLNRDPSGTVLYDNASNTELCPVTTFDMDPIYKIGAEPNPDEIIERTADYWRPYHDKIATELGALKEQFGVAILLEGHTIRSEVQRFYKGRIPDLNLGTASGASAAPDLAERVLTLLMGNNYSVVLDDRFTGGYITRTYGDPANNIHAIQLELTWRTYMNEQSFAYLPDRADRLKTLLERLLKDLLSWSEAQQRSG